MRRAIRYATIIAVGAGAGILAPGVAVSQQGLQLTTPYPIIAVQPGETASFSLDVTAPGRRRVALAVAERPEGWRVTLRGGGFQINGVYTRPGDPPQVQADVEVPADVDRGTYSVVIQGRSDVGSDSLELRLRVTRAASGTVSLTAEFPQLQGAADTTFSFALELANNAPQETSFSIEAAGPEGWQVTASPTGQQQAATTTVPPGGTATIDVQVDPPDDITAGTYPVGVRVSGGGKTAETELEVEITGNVALTLTTPDERLNAEVVTGGETEVQMVVVNDGTAPLVGVTLSATPPADWNVTFRPETIDMIQPGETAQATAVIAPSGEAVAGDYVVTMTASVPEATGDAEIRVTVQTSRLWGLVGLLLVAAAVGSLVWVFRRFGRR